MAHIGQVLENPVTGEVVVFRRTAAETYRKRVEIDVTLGPDAGAVDAHVHPAREEHLAAIGQQSFGTVKLPDVPAVLQRVVLRLATPLGRATPYSAI